MLEMNQGDFRMKYFCRILIVGTIASMLVGEELSAATPASQHGASAERVSQSADVTQNKSDPNRRQSERVQKPVPFDQMPERQREAAYVLIEEALSNLQIWVELDRLVDAKASDREFNHKIVDYELHTADTLRKIVNGSDWLEKLVRQYAGTELARKMLAQPSKVAPDATTEKKLVARAKRVLRQKQIDEVTRETGKLLVRGLLDCIKSLNSIANTTDRKAVENRIEYTLRDYYSELHLCVPLMRQGSKSRKRIETNEAYQYAAKLKGP